MNIFETVMESAVDFNNRTMQTHTVNFFNLYLIENYCHVLDKLYDDNFGEYCTTEIDNETFEPTIKIGLTLIVAEGKDDLFYELVKRSVKFKVVYCNADCIELCFTFPSLWDD